MHELKKVFFNKKILIYGLGLSGKSSFKFLQKKNDVRVYDDNNIQLKKFKKNTIKNTNSWLTLSLSEIKSDGFFICLLKRKI